jgi:hypothetical protein
MKFKSGVRIIVILLCLGVLISSCRTIKPVVINKGSSIENIYDSLKLSEPNYKSLNIKFSVKYQKKSESMSLKGNLKILKDSIIWVSLSPGLGIEAVRLMCTKDSVYLLDKLNGSLTKGKYEYLKTLYKIDVDYHSLQSILTNNFFIYPSVNNEKNEFIKNFIISKDSVELAVYRKDNSQVENLVNINRKNYVINSYVINDVPNRRNLAVNYQMKGNQKSFPGSINIRSQNEDKFLLIDLDYTKITLDEELTFSFKVPKDYKVIVH